MKAAVKTLVISVMALLVGISPGVAIADVQFSVRLGPAKIVAGSGGLRGSVRLGTHHRNRIRHPKAYDPYHQRRRVIVYRDRVREEEIPAQPVAIPPVSTQPEDPPAPSVDREPLDPVGHARVTSAPGAVPARFGLGDRVPTGVPHVTLDAERYGLPRAPEGELYARVRNQVLRITNTDRQITELIVD